MLDPTATATRTEAPRAADNAALLHGTIHKVLIFGLGDQDYGIELEAVSEILPMPTLSRPPGVPPILAGFLDLGGVAVAALRLGILFGYSPREPELYTPLILLRSPGPPLALLVDAVKGIASIDTLSVVPFFENDCADGLVTVADRSVIVLSSHRLLREQEQRRISELAAVEQARLDVFREVAS
jgi:purine-binding chemotaxis protein CheW